MTSEQMLQSMASELDWPTTPDVAEAVSARIAAHAPRTEAVPTLEGVTPRHPGDSGSPRAWPGRRVRLGRPLAIAIAALLLLAATAAAIPGIRDPVLDWLGLRSVKIERVPARLPEAPGAELGLGQRTTLLGVRKALDFEPVVPTGIGTPAYYVEGFPPGGQLGLAYRNGIVVTEVQGHLETRYLQKFLPPGTKADQLKIDGGPALWIHGAPHQYAYVDRTGQVRTDSVRTAGDVLLWRRGDVLVRIEGARAKAVALALARSVRAVPRARP
jgi:hypothetical protein